MFWVQIVSFFFFNSFVNFRKKCSFFGHILEQLATLLWWCLQISYLCMCHVYDLIIPRVHRCLTAARSFQDSAVIIKSLVYTKLYYRRVKLTLLWSHFHCCWRNTALWEEKKNSSFFVLKSPRKHSWVTRRIHLFQGRTLVGFSLHVPNLSFFSM